MFILLPVELILFVISFLPTVRDKVRLRCVSRKLRSLCDTPSLWRHFEWPSYEDRACEESCVLSVLKSLGEQVKFLSFPDHVPPSKLVKMLKNCYNVVQLNVPTTQLNLEQVRNVLHHMKYLKKLDIQWSRETWRLLKLTFNTNLKELTVRVKMNIMGKNGNNQLVNTGPFVAPLYAWVKEWMYKKFVPQNITFVTSGFDSDYHILVSELFRVWLRLNRYSPSGHTGFLTFYTATSLDVFPAFPDFQIEFGQTAVLPIVKASDFQVLGLDREWIYLTECIYRGNRVYKAACMESCKELVVKRFDLPDFTSVVQFDFSGCRSLLSGHLEQVSITCPNLQQLGLQCNKRCLRKLRGLQSVANNCKQLNGLNLVTIGDVENQLQFWETLSSMKLTHLAIDICLIEPAVLGVRDYLVELYRKFINLKAIELNSALYCRTCNSLKNKQFLLLPKFVSLEFCMISNVHPVALTGVISSCKSLKYFSCSYISGELPSSVCSYSLQEISISSCDVILTDAFMCAISAHGVLIHVVLDVKSVTCEGIAAVITNSPNLLSFHMFVDVDIEPDLENFASVLKERFYNRKLFTMGSYKLVQGDQEEYEHNTKFLPLWKYPFWADVDAENTSSYTDVLTTADFDKHPDPYITEEFGLSW